MTLVAEWKPVAGGNGVRRVVRGLDPRIISR